jgi:hypothetical protein
MKALIIEARKIGKHVMVAGIEAQNHASIHLHETLGFVTTGQMPQVGTKFGRWLDFLCSCSWTSAAIRTLFNESITDAGFSGGGGYWPGGAKHLDGAHHPVLLHHPYRDAAEFTGGHCAVCQHFAAETRYRRIQRAGLNGTLVDADPWAAGSFFVFASISGYQNVGAATTIAVLVASQLIGGLVMDVLKSNGIPLRALIGPVCAVMLVVGAWLVARRQF